MSDSERGFARRKSLLGTHRVLYNGCIMGDQRDQVVDAPGPSPREAHCILWHAQNLPASSELRAALDRRGMEVYEHDQRATAFAELCRQRGPRVGPVAPANRPVILVFVEPDRLHRPEDLKELLERYAPRTAMWLYRASANPQLRAVTEQDLLRWRSQRPAPQPRVAASIKSPQVWADAKSARKSSLPPAPVAPVIVGPRLKLAGQPRPSIPEGAEPGLTGPEHKASAPAMESPAPPGGPCGSVEPKPEAEPGMKGADLRQLLSEEELAMLLAGDVRPSQV